MGDLSRLQVDPQRVDNVIPWIPDGVGHHTDATILTNPSFHPTEASLLEHDTAIACMQALVVSQVLLATAWYVASCWCFSYLCVAQLRHLVWNFLWSGSDGSSDTRAKIAWQTVILHKQKEA